MELTLALCVSLPNGAIAQAVWQVATTPILDIGSTAADGSILLGNPISAARLSTGNILVADEASSSVKVFDERRRLVASVGRLGRGPGEFPRMAMAAPCGDSIVIWDPSRTSVVGPSGAVGRVVSVPNGRGPSIGSDLRCSRSGSIAYVANSAYTNTQIADVFLTRSIVVRAAGDGQVEWISDSLSEGERVNARPGGYERPLGARLHLAFVGNSVVVGTSDSARVWVFGTDGARRTVKWPESKRRPPTQEEYEVAAKRVAERAPPAFRSNTEQSLLRLPRPSILPAFYGLWGDSEQMLWIQTSAPGGKQTDFLVVDTAGRIVARATIERDLVVQEIGRDHITGIVTDASDEPHVIVLRLIRLGSRRL